MSKISLFGGFFVSMVQKLIEPDDLCDICDTPTFSKDLYALKDGRFVCFRCLKEDKSDEKEGIAQKD